MNSYKFDNTNLIYTPKSQKNIGYRDGGEVFLKKIFQSDIDKSTLSDSLIDFMKDWPSEYHLSRKRHLILRPFNIKPGDKVLELGCGCGAITRYLGEIGAEVVAVEGELERASVAANRCKDLPNVKVVADNILELNLTEKFDWILFIGVFEYSQKYGKTNNRQAEYLDIVKKHLATDGTLLIAIENKLGIKYLNGAGEDHNGIKNYGIQDLYTSNDVTTWGKEELKEILHTAGFSSNKFYGVFPDYKLPKVIFSEEISAHRNFRAEELVLSMKSLDYQGNNTRQFEESLLLSSLRKNGLMIDFSNSFLIEAKLSQSPKATDSPLAYYFSIDRKKDFCTSTTFEISPDGEIKTSKKYLLEDNSIRKEYRKKIKTKDDKSIEIVQLISTNSDEYLSDRLMAFDFTLATHRKNIHQAVAILNSWSDYLISNYQLFDRATDEKLSKAHIGGRDLSSIMIEGTTLDCGLHNVVHGSTMEAFDLEWVALNPIPLSWVLTRSARQVLRLGFGQPQMISISEVVGLLSDHLGLIARSDDIQEANHLETEFVTGIPHIEPSNKSEITIR